MQALELLLNRHSQPRLQAPAPEGDALDNILRAGLRAPDHAALSPWRFIVCQGKGLDKLGDMLSQTAISEDMSERDRQRAPDLPRRAPMVIVACMQYKPHEKVPRVEQIASTACAVHAMQMAALAQGFDGIWRTGSYAQSESLKSLLGLTPDDEIVGFLYLGTSPLKPVAKPDKDTDDFVEYWS